MRYKTIRILKCPKCGGDLKLEIDDEEERKEPEAISGSLKCLTCGSIFKIEEGIIFMDFDP